MAEELTILNEPNIESKKVEFGTEKYSELQSNSVLQQYGERRLDLKYFFPQLGTLEITLFSDSRELFRFLEQAKEIERLKKMPHLGIISKLIESARHSKWEYALLTMYVVHLAKTTKHQIGLSREVVLGDQKISISSGEELLKMWALLLNQGHLFGTFVAERSVMVALLTDPALKQSFVDGFEDPQIREYVQRILEEQDIYHFHHALAFFFLCHFPGRIQEHQRLKWVEVLKAYCIDSRSQQLQFLKQTYRALRRVAYLTLDMNYAPVPLSLNTHVLFSNFVDYAPHIVMLTDHPIVKALNQLDAFIQDEVYLSVDSMRFARAVADVWPAKFLQDVRPHADEKPIQAFRRVIMDQRHHLYGSQGIEKKLDHFTRLRFPFEYLPEENGERLISEEREWNAKLEGTGASVSVWTALGQRKRIIDVFLNTEMTQIEEFLRKFFVALIELGKADQSRRTNFIPILYGVLCRNLMVDILNHFGAKNVTFGHKRQDAFELQFGSILADSRQRAIKVISDISDCQDFESLPAHRRDQIFKLKSNLERESESRKPTGIVLASLSEVVFKNEQTNQEGEIDAIQLTCSKKGIFVTFVEAKHMQSRGNAKAFSELCDKFEKIGKNKSEIEMLKYRGGAAGTFQLQ